MFSAGTLFIRFGKCSDAKMIENRKWEDPTDALTDLCAAQLWRGFVLDVEKVHYAEVRNTSFLLLQQLRDMLYEEANE